MVSLAHMCLLKILETQNCDLENPIVADQVFGAEMNYGANKHTIVRLKTKITRTKRKVHNMCGMKNLNLDLSEIDKLSVKLARELFDIFNWNIIKTKKQAEWKEYFHDLYDLIIGDYDNDHTGNLILAREIVRYHDVLEVPSEISYHDKLYPHIASISELFNKIKKEQVKISDELSELKNIMRQNQRIQTDLQYKIIIYQSELKQLEMENNMYKKIIRWSQKIHHM
jgi:hypothetical protein